MAVEYEPVIGLEIHVQLATQSKMFCSCPAEFAAPPNANTCPVCMGLPGVLPVINRRAVESAIRMGLATHCAIRRDSQFARKNYFYPDLPKAYQISQYDRPICERGWIEIEVEGKPKRIGITRIHMEEDAGKLVHEGSDPRASYVDLNRAGVPLLEIVSEPDLSSPDEAKAYMEKIHALVTWLGVSRGDMEKGNLRADANVSIRPKGDTRLGTRAEVKNVNSFRFVREAIEYEIQRQTEELEAGRPLRQETRLYDPMTRTTFPMRAKEEAHDYRYFPEPDLPIVAVDEAWMEDIRRGMPELPDAKAARFHKDYGLSAYDAAVLVASRESADFYEQAIAVGADPKAAAHWVTGALAAKLNEDKASLSDLKFSPAQLAELIALVADGTLSGRMAKTVFDEMYASGKGARRIVEEQGLAQVSDSGELEKIIDSVISSNPGQVAQFRSGKDKVFGFFVGQVMKASKGQANPQLVNDLLRRKLA
jgi:aspartyl-tRNA(Asn)/glutamyl-tRNA(Gln) amidotransferase subunit B